MRTLTNDTQSFAVMLAAAQKLRSIASEGGYLDLLEGGDGVRGLAPLTGSTRAVEVLADLAAGERTIDDIGFRNLCRAFDLEGLGVLLAVKGYEIPN